MNLIKLAASLSLFTGMAQASTLQQLDLYSSSAAFRISGDLYIAANTSTYKVFTSTIDGSTGITTSKRVRVSSSVIADSFFGNGANITGLVVSTSALYAQVQNIAVDTGTIYGWGDWHSSLASTATYVNYLASQVATSTAAIITSTGAFVLRSGDTMTGPLFISSTSGSNIKLGQYGTGGAYGAIGFGGDTSITGFSVGGGAASNTNMNRPTGYNMMFLENGDDSNPQMYIKTGGFVGIGTFRPSAKLSVENGAVWSTGTGAGFYTTGNSTATQFSGDGSLLTGLPTLLQLGTTATALASEIATRTGLTNAYGAALATAAYTVTDNDFGSHILTTTGKLVTPRISFNTAAVAISSEATTTLGGGFRISSNTYIVGFASATKYYGDGGSLTGIASSFDYGSSSTYTGDNYFKGVSTMTGIVETRSSDSITTATYQISWSSGSIYTLVLKTNTTLTFANAKANQTLTFLINQDSTGGRTITWPTITWVPSVAPTLQTTAGAVDAVSVFYDGSSYLGFYGYSTSTVGNVFLASTQTFTGSNTFNNNTSFLSSVTVNGSITASSITVTGTGIAGLRASSATFTSGLYAMAADAGDNIKTYDSNGNLRWWLFQNNQAKMNGYNASNVLSMSFNAAGLSYFNGGNLGVGDSANNGSKLTVTGDATVIGSMTVTSDIGINGNNVISGSSWTATPLVSALGANTYSDIPAAFAVVAGSTYTFNAYAVFITTQTSTGYGFSINGPATYNLSYVSRGELTTTTQGATYATAYDQPSTALATSVVAGTFAELYGTLCPSSNGTVTLRFSSEIKGNPTGNVTMVSARITWVKWK